MLNKFVLNKFNFNFSKCGSILSVNSLYICGVSFSFGNVKISVVVY